MHCSPTLETWISPTDYDGSGEEPEIGPVKFPLEADSSQFVIESKQLKVKSMITCALQYTLYIPILHRSVS